MSVRPRETRWPECVQICIRIQCQFHYLYKEHKIGHQRWRLQERSGRITITIQKSNLIAKGGIFKDRNLNVSFGPENQARKATLPRALLAPQIKTGQKCRSRQ